MALNKVQLIGHLGQAPEVRSFQNGARVANLTVATSEYWKDKATGERKQKTEWHKVSVFQEGSVKFCESYLKKGSKVYVEGKLETRSYDKDGETRYITEITIRTYNGTIQSLDKREDSGNQGQDYQAPAQNNNNNDSGAEAFADDFDDEIPF